MNENSFHYAVLRYVHDPATEEFINVGIVVYSAEARYIKARISTRYSRLSCTFQSINGEHYRRITTYIERSIAQRHINFQQPSLWDALPEQLVSLLNQILPPDDASLVFAGYGSGLTSDLDAELDYLYDRLVERYTERPEAPSRNDQQVWQVYSQEFDRTLVTLHLSPVKIATPTYHYTFDYAWKNQRWHPVEPVSLDLGSERAIQDKVARWIGRTAMLENATELGTLYMLLGAPRRHELHRAYGDAVQNLKSKAHLPVELVEEEQAAAFSQELASLIESHQPAVEKLP